MFKRNLFLPIPRRSPGKLCILPVFTTENLRYKKQENWKEINDVVRKAGSFSVTRPSGILGFTANAPNFREEFGCSCLFFFFLVFDFCRFCVVIRFFHPRHTGQ